MFTQLIKKYLFSFFKIQNPIVKGVLVLLMLFLIPVLLFLFASFYIAAKITRKPDLSSFFTREKAYAYQQTGDVLIFDKNGNRVR